MKKSKTRLLVIGSAAILLFVAYIAYVWAGSVTAATGGDAISADTAANGGTGAWTALSGPTYAETSKGELIIGTVILTAPTGFQFNTGTTVSVVLIAGNSNSNTNMNNTALGGFVATTTNGSLTVTATTITFNVTSNSKGSTLNTIQWQGIQVRPTNGYPLASGNITPSGTSGIATAASSTNFGTLTEVPGAMTNLLTVLPGQTFTAGTGITGTPSAQAAGTSFNLTQLVATDQFYNPVTSYSGTKTLSYSGPSSGCSVLPNYTTSVSFSNGISTTTLTTTLIKTETTNITASDGTTTGPASSSFTVTSAPLSLLVVTLPGQNFTACFGNSGTPSNQTAGVSFNIPIITATDSYYNVITSYAGNKTLFYSGPSGPATYTTTVSFTGGQSTTALATTISNPQTTTISVSDGTISGPTSSAFTVNAPPIASFNAFESSTASLAVTTGVIMTKISGTAFGLDIVALNGTGAVSTGFTGTVKVELVDSSNGTSCSAYSSIQTLANQTFSSADLGRHTISSIVEANAWKNVRLRISYPVTSPTTISCSYDNFAIRPSSLGTLSVSDQDWQTAGTSRLLNNTALPPNGIIHKAGQPFTLNASGLNSANNVTTNYAGTPVAILSQCSSGSETCPSTANLGSLSLGAWSSNAGVVTSNNASYSDVGAFAMVLQDQHFADVDINDSSTTQRYITSPSITVGRFVPDHFAVNIGAITPRTDLSGCVNSSFTYMNEPFTVSYILTAQNAVNSTTNNYSGYVGSASGGLASLNTGNPSHLNLAAVDSAGILTSSISSITAANPGKVTTSKVHGLNTGSQVYISGVGGMTNVNNVLYTVTVIDANNFTIGVNTSTFGTYTAGGTASRLSVISPTTLQWSNGAVAVTSTAALQRSAQPDGPFNSTSIGIAPQDADGVQALTSSFNLDTDSNGSNERINLGATKLWFGRMWLNNAYGSEQLNLPIPIQTQYWTGNFFAINAQDNCTFLSSASNVILNNQLGGLNSTNMSSPANVQLGSVFNGGLGSLMLSKPSPSPTTKGSTDVSVDLVAENKSYLQSRWSGTNYNQNPKARAAFGVYNGGPILYRRELY